MNVLISTTTHWNPGDDFIREGLFHLLPELANHSIEYFDRNPHVTNKRMERKFSWAELYLHAGTPDWLTVHEEEYRLLQKRGVPYAFIGVGSPGADKYSECSDWLRDLLTHRLCVGVIVRDAATSAVLKELGVPHHLLPCPAYFLFAEEAAHPGRRQVIGLGVYAMNREGHSRHELASRFYDLYRTIEQHLLKAEFDVVLVCHTLEDHIVARQSFKSPAIFSQDFRHYRRVYQGLSGYIGSRVHGAIAAASAMRPAVHLGLDSRMGTCDLFPHITNLPWEQGNPAVLRQLDDLIQSRTLGREAYGHKRETAWRYSQALNSVRDHLGCVR